MVAPTLVAGTSTSTASRSTTGNNLVVNYPSGSASGDFLLLFFYTAASAAALSTHTVPSGWISVYTDDSPNGAAGTQHMSVFRRIRGAETSVTPSWTGQVGYATATIVAYQPSTVDSDDPVTEVGTHFYNTGTATTVVAPQINTGVADSRVVTFVASLDDSASAYTHTWTGPASELSEVHTTSAAGQSIAQSIAHDTVASPGAAGTRTATFSTSVIGRYAKSFALAPPHDPYKVAYVGGTNGTTTINAPVDTADGDVLVCTIADMASSGTYTWPTDWVELVDDVSTNLKTGIAYYIWNTGDPTSWSVPTAASHNVCLGYRYVNNTTPFVNQNFNNTTTDSTPTTPSISNNSDTGNMWVASFSVEDSTSRAFVSVDSGGSFRQEAAWDSTNDVCVAMCDSSGVVTPSASVAVTGTWNGAPDSGVNWVGILSFQTPIVPVDAPAESASAAGTSDGSTVRLGGLAESASVTSAANAPLASLKANPDTSSASAVANDATITAVNGARPDAGEISVSAAANDASNAVKVNSEEVSAGSAANDAVAKVGASPDTPGAAATANNATISTVPVVSASAESASASTAAQDANAGIGGASTDTSASATANDASVHVRPGAGVSTADGVAQDGFIATVPSAFAFAEVAEASGTADGQTTAVEAFSEATESAGTAGDVMRPVPADVATAAASAFDATVTVKVNAESSVADAVANDITATTDNDALPGAATSTATVDSAAAKVGGPSEEVTSSATANDATVRISFIPDTAMASTDVPNVSPAEKTLVEAANATAAAFDAEIETGIGTFASVAPVTATAYDATVVAEGILVHPRKYTVEAESRNTRVERDDRTFKVELENRNTIIGRDERTFKVEVEARETAIAGVDVG